MNQLLILILVYFFISYSGYSQTHQHFPSDSTCAEVLSGAETYLFASVKDNEQLCIKTSNNREIIFEKDSTQAGFDKIRISDDGKAIGWLELYNNNSTSYPIPLKLKIYSAGKIHLFTGTGLPIWLWSFMESGNLVAYRQETVHGGFGVHYELREVATGLLIADHSPEYGPDNQQLVIQKNVPKWVEDLNDSN